VGDARFHHGNTLAGLACPPLQIANAALMPSNSLAATPPGSAAPAATPEILFGSLARGEGRGIPMPTFLW
jgi:hypothetical protein